MEWVSKIFEVVKLPIRYAWVVVVVSGLLLFLPDRALEKLHVLKLTHDYDTYIGLAFLITAVIAVIEFLVWAWRAFHARGARKKRRQATEAALRNLDGSEKAVLREFWLQDKNTIQCPVDQQTVAGLMTKGILVLAGKYGERSTAGMLFPVKLAEGIHVTLDMIDLPGGEPTPEERDFVIRNRPDFLPEIEAHNDLFHKSWWNRSGFR